MSKNVKIMTENVKNQAEEIETVEAESTEMPEIDTPKPEPRTKTRPRKTSARPRRTQAQQRKDTETLAKRICGVHALIAVATGLPELNLQEQEGEQLAQSFEAICEEYGFEVSGKTGAALQLFAAAAMVYVPRAIMIKGRLDLERAKAQQAEPPSDYQNYTGGHIVEIPQN